MKVITEAMIRNELKMETPETYTIPEDKLLSPAAREYLMQLKVKIIDKKQNKPLPMREKRFNAEEETAEAPVRDEAPEAAPQAAERKPRYVDEQTGAFYYEKPEHMTQLHGNLLVNKDDKRILFRGKLDSLEAQFVLMQTELIQMGESKWIVDDLEDVLNSIREIMRSDVLDQPFSRDTIIGLNHDELREQSHNPMKYYKVKQMVLPSYSLGKTYAMLNLLRAAVRETEVAAASAFNNGKGYDKADIIEELNRTSSAMHIIMCKYLAQMQNKEEA